MKLTHENYEHLSVVKVHGDLTAGETETLRKLVRERLARETRDFVLDVAEMEFVDSQGLETLLWLQDECAPKLGQVRLAGVTPNVEKILHVTRLGPRFDRHETVEAAVKSLRL